MARTWSDPGDDAAYYARANQEWSRIDATRRIVTPADAQAVNTMAANYPHMSPGVTLPLAKAGIATDDPVAMLAATESAKLNNKKRGFWGAVGDHVNPLKYIGGAVSNVLNPIAGVSADALKWGTRTGTAVLGAVPEIGLGVVRNISAAGGNFVAGATTGGLAGAGVGAFFGGVGALPGWAVGALAGGVAGVGAGALAEMKDVNIESEGFVNPLTQTTLAQSFGSAGLGKGYFASGTAHEQAVDAQRRAASLNGHALTPGRFLANSVLEEGSTPYNLVSGLLDASVAWKLDPSAAALKGASRWRRAQKAFVAADEVAKVDVGLVNSARRTILPERVDSWLQGDQGAKVTQWLADETDFETIRRELGKGKVDVSTVLDLTNARTPEEVAAVLRPKLGLPGALQEKPSVGGFGTKVTRTYQDSARVFNEMPSGVVDLHNPTEAVEQFDLLQRNAKVSKEAMSANNKAMAEALIKGDRTAAKRVFYDQFWGGDDGILAQHNILPELRRRLAKDLRIEEDVILRSFVTEDGTKTAVRALDVGGTTNGLPNPGFLAGGLDDVIAFDREAIRSVRRVTSRFPKIMTSKTYMAGVGGLDFLLTDLWKPLQLIRGAWTTRVVGEEQIRMAASGNTSMFAHPLSHMSWMLADDGKIAGIFKKFGVDVEGRLGRGGVDIAGEAFAREGSTIVPNMDLERELRGAASDFADATNIKAQAEGWLEGTNVLAKHKATYVVGDPDYHMAWAEKIEQLHRDPVTRKLATEHPEDVRLWFSGGEGAEIRRGLVERGAPLRSYAEIDGHIEMARKNVAHAAGGEYRAPGKTRELGAPKASNPLVTEAISTGELNGVPIYKTNGELNKDFIGELKKLGAGPDEITGMAVISRGGKETFKKTMDDGVRKIFTAFMAAPSAKLSRSPHFRQSYWDEADNIIYSVTPETQAKMLAAAEEAKLPRVAIERLKGRAALGSGDMKLDEADLILKGAALDKTQALLYDTAQRGQLSDVLRVLVPFGEAQKEVFKVWTKIGTKNPAVLRRTQQIVEGARGSGFFHKDPSTGEEMFRFPLSEQFTNIALGTPVPLSGRVSGLNMFGSGIMPGLGPAAQLPAAWLLADKPQYEDLYKLIDPYGSSRDEGGIVESQLPAWFQKVRTGLTKPEDDRVFANTVKDVWASGVSSGRYSADTPEEIKEGLEHAKQMAGRLYMIRGIASVLGAPTAPTPEMMAMDKDGHWIVTEKLAEDYQKMMKEDIETASQNFLEKYGNNAFAFLQNKSYATTAVAPTSTDAAGWLNTHPGLVDKYEDVIGLFAPQGEDFDFNQYVRNIKSGATVSLTPEQYARSANDKLGKMVWFNAKDRFGPSPSKPQREFLSNLRHALREQFPGFDETLPGKPDQETVKNKFIPQIEKAVNDPKLVDNNVAQATKVYLAARAKATAAAKKAGYSDFSQAKGATSLRQWIRSIGDALIKEIPDFAPMYERIFEREMIDDGQVAAGAPA
jgi:hypothetical protein